MKRSKFYENIRNFKNKSTISFEVFPPKNKEGNISSIYSTIEGLAKLSPDFISVTYGAGGSTKGKTVEIASVIKHEYGIESVAHLSCISSTKEDIKYECERLKEAGIDNILALREIILQMQQTLILRIWNFTMQVN